MTVPRHVYIFLAAGLIAVSQSGNIIRLGDTHALLIAAWRLLLAAIFLSPLGMKQLHTLKALTAKEIGLLVITGVILAAHFLLWIAAVQMTTVANAAIFFSINPVLTATAAYFVFREAVSTRLVISIALGIAGIAVIGSSDLRFHPGNVAGDLSSIGCSVLFTVYFLLGRRLRPKIPTGAYVVVVYAIAAIACFITAFILQMPIIEHDSQTWLCFVLMALIPTVIGHTSLNNALRYISPGRVSAATLVEPMLAGIVAYFAWDEAITGGAALGYIFIAASVLVLTIYRLKRSKSRD